MENQADETRLERLARKAASYHSALLAQGVPAKLAQMLVRDWHRLQVEEHRTRVSPTERLLSELISEIRSQRPRGITG